MPMACLQHHASTPTSNPGSLLHLSTCSKVTHTHQNRRWHPRQMHQAPGVGACCSSSPGCLVCRRPAARDGNPPAAQRPKPKHCTVAGAQHTCSAAGSARYEAACPRYHDDCLQQNQEQPCSLPVALLHMHVDGLDPAAYTACAACPTHPLTLFIKMQGLHNIPQAHAREPAQVTQHLSQPSAGHHLQRNTCIGQSCKSLTARQGLELGSCCTTGCAYMPCSHAASLQGLEG